ncbi:glucokinase [Paraliobacillus quinghaiensis]|uniref:Glucokinase n=1 Tax=Paraliobacillus quinghaiensis TaxID=470815 RepID=A0A917TPY9_9BACI|nr:ROK family glucokinase [Paraliobacillus quinghaiensis]GGM31574.1 glucokinase [Paraliobacillus quinghaiensis]
MEKFLLGVDIGGTTVKIGVITYNGDIVDKWEIPTSKGAEAEKIPHDIWRSIETKLEELNIDLSNVLGIGAGAPGFVDTATGEVSIAVNLGWENFKLAEILHELSGLSVYVDNDANIAAVGENWKGSGNLADNFIAVTLGTGVGGGIIANGQVVNGTNGTAGEIGHIMVEPGGAPCNCGRNGCLETIASATGIARLANEAVAEGKDTLLKEQLQQKGTITAKDVFDLAAKDDYVARSIIDDVTNVLGLALANIATVINPSKIILGGGVSKAGEQLLQPLQKAFTNYALPRIDEGCEFAIATLGNDAGIFGGAYLVKEGYES